MVEGVLSGWAAQVIGPVLLMDTILPIDPECAAPPRGSIWTVFERCAPSGGVLRQAVRFISV